MAAFDPFLPLGQWQLSIHFRHQRHVRFRPIADISRFTPVYGPNATVASGSASEHGDRHFLDPLRDEFGLATAPARSSYICIT